MFYDVYFSFFPSLFCFLGERVRSRKKKEPASQTGEGAHGESSIDRDQQLTVMPIELAAMAKAGPGQNVHQQHVRLTTTARSDCHETDPTDDRELHRLAMISPGTYFGRLTCRICAVRSPARATLIVGRDRSVYLWRRSGTA